MRRAPAPRSPKGLPAALLGAFVILAVAFATASPAGAAPRRSWAFTAMQVPSDRPGGDAVRVAVVDSGIDGAHPAFSGRIVGEADCVDSGGSPESCRPGAMDDNGHGTHIAGIIAARDGHGAPEGVAPDVELLAVRSLRNTCEPHGRDEQCRALGRLEDVVAGVRWAAAHGAHIINLSIDASVGLDWRDGDLAGAIHDAWGAGAVVVASTGNRGVTIDDPDLASVPLLLVGAVSASRERASYSNLPGTARWGLMAPGGEASGTCDDNGVVSTYPTSITAAGTGCLSGTSMAAAYTSGALASLMSAGLDGRLALAHLVATAKPSPGGRLVDLDAALSAPAWTATATDTGADPAVSRADGTGSEAVSSASLGDWTRTHPLRSRAVAIAAIALAVAVITSRRRSADSLLGF